MSDPNPTLSRTATVPDHVCAVAMLVQPLLDELVGPGTAPVSLGLEYGADIQAGESVELSAGVIRATRTLVFAQARITSATGQLAADVSAVFRRLPDPENETHRTG